MADMETALRARLQAWSALSAIIGTKVAWEEQPQGVALPHLTLTVISDPRPQHLKGYDGARETRVQADCRATTKAVALQMARAVIAAVAEPGVFSEHVFGRTKAEGPRALNEVVSGATVFRQSADLLVWHVGD